MPTDAEIKVILGSFRPKLTIGFNKDAWIPPGYGGWCHKCELAFKDLEETMKHVRETHQLKG